jgi:hypothetical protein
MSKDFLGGFSGYLNKKGQEVKLVWHKRYFIIKDDVLLYFKSQSDVHHPLGIMYLYKGFLNRSPVYKKKDSTFILNSQGRRYHLQAENDEKRKEWCDRLDEAIRRANRDLVAETKELQNEILQNRSRIVAISKSIDISTKPITELVSAIKTLNSTWETNFTTKQRSRVFTTFERKEESFSLNDRLGDSGEIFQNANSKLCKIRDEISKHAFQLSDTAKNYRLEMEYREKEDTLAHNTRYVAQEIRDLKHEKNDLIDVFIQCEDDVGNIVSEGLEQFRKWNIRLQQAGLVIPFHKKVDDSGVQDEIQRLREKAAKNDEEIKLLQHHKKVLLKEVKATREAKAQ